MKQKGIITYSISPNKQNVLAGTAHAAVFNVWRRFSKQVLYWAPPLVVFYYAMEWTTHRYVPVPVHSTTDPRSLITLCSNHYLNSKAGRAEFGGQEE